jgi:NAD(P)-dependent dehydrogenase (short-subunit alcohol dehydrogenase family)
MPVEGVLSGRVVVVTGVADGLGRAYLEPLARAGASLVLNDINGAGLTAAEAAVRELGTPVASVHGSVTDWGVATRLVETAVQAFGGLDALVNNAGTHYVTPSQDDTPDRMRDMVEVNILGTMYPGVAVLRYLTETGRPGTILNVTSGAACGMPFVASYSASKGAVSSLTYAWAAEFRDQGIRVNALAPAAYTRQVQNTMEVRHSPVVWGPEKIAPLVVYLLSDLSGDITGQVVRLWGDDLHLVSHPHPKPPWLSDGNWTTDSLDAAFRDTLRAHLEPYSRDMTEYVPFPGSGAVAVADQV